MFTITLTREQILALIALREENLLRNERLAHLSGDAEEDGDYARYDEASADEGARAREDLTAVINLLFGEPLDRPNLGHPKGHA